MNKRQTARNLIIDFLSSSKATEENPDEIETALEILKAAWQIETPSLPNIKSLLDLIPDSNPAKALQLKVEGNTALQQGNLDLAIEKYTEAIANDPTQETFYSNRAAAYSKKNFHEKAIIDAEKAISINPNFASGYSRLGYAYWSLGRIEDAKKTYKKGLLACPGNESLKENLASLEPAKPQPQNSGVDMASLLQNFMANPNFLGQLQEKMGSPEVQEILAEPGMSELVEGIKSNPMSLLGMMGDPRVQRLLSVLQGSGDNLPEETDFTRSMYA